MLTFCYGSGVAAGNISLEYDLAYQICSLFVGERKKDAISPKEDVIKNFEIFEMKMLDNYIVLTTLLV